jgi:hypothetical protein
MAQKQEMEQEYLQEHEQDLKLVQEYNTGWSRNTNRAGA